MKMRLKDPTLIRQDALRVASRKLVEGCSPCVAAYVDLARRNGASAEEIDRIYRSGVEPTDSSFIAGSLGISSRGTSGGLGLSLKQSAARDMDSIPSKKTLLPGIAFVEPASSMPLGASTERRSLSIPSGRRIPPILEEPQGDDDPYGADSNTDPSVSQGRFAGPSDFYIGEMGTGLNAYPVTNAGWNNAAAAAATRPRTYGYWGLVGPGQIPRDFLPPDLFPDLSPSDRARAWGGAQAVAALAAINPILNGPYSTLVGGRTIFADIEMTQLRDGTFWPGGWFDNNQALNQQTLNGFLDIVYFAGLNPGVYIHVRDINGPNHTFLGPDTSYTPSRNFVFWTTGPVCNLPICLNDGSLPATGNCCPCTLACDLQLRSAILNNWGCPVQNACLAGHRIVIWQFYISNCQSNTCLCPADFNFAMQAADNFHPEVGCTPTPCLVLAPNLKCPQFADRTPAAFDVNSDMSTKWVLNGCGELCIGNPFGPIVSGWVLGSGASTPTTANGSCTGTGIAQPLNPHGTWSYFQFNIPANATILGIEVAASANYGPSVQGAYTRRVTVNDPSCATTDRNAYTRSYDSIIAPCYGATIRIGNGFNVSQSKPLQNGASVYGGRQDLWGTSFTTAQINDPNFFVAINIPCVAQWSSDRSPASFVIGNTCADCINSANNGTIGGNAGAPPAALSMPDLGLVLRSVRVYYQL